MRRICIADTVGLSAGPAHREAVVGVQPIGRVWRLSAVHGLRLIYVNSAHVLVDCIISSTQEGPCRVDKIRME